MLYRYNMENDMGSLKAVNSYIGNVREQAKLFVDLYRTWEALELRMDRF